MTPKQLMDWARGFFFPSATGQVQKRQTRFTYNAGPMLFLGQQIVKAMEDSGYPAKIIKHYRPPHEQQVAFDRRASKARPWQSPHQFYEAVDIVHPSKLWFEGHPDHEMNEYFDQLRSCGQIVADRFGVTLEFGRDWGWDSAHIEIEDWRSVRDMMQSYWDRGEYLDAQGLKQPPDADLLAMRFQQVLPKEWAQYRRRN